MTIRRTINGKPVSDEEMKDYMISNKHVINTLYQAQRRAIEANKAES